MVAPSVACLCHQWETGTPSRAACGTSAANQPIQGFRGSTEGSPEWHTAGFIFDRTPEASARHHLLGDVGLGPHISGFICRSFNVLYVYMYVCVTTYGGAVRRCPTSLTVNLIDRQLVENSGVVDHQIE